MIKVQNVHLFCNESDSASVDWTANEVYISSPDEISLLDFLPDEMVAYTVTEQSMLNIKICLEFSNIYNHAFGKLKFTEFNKISIYKSLKAYLLSK